MPTKEQTAAAELRQAEQDVEKLLERIKNGDRKVGPEDLEAAERRVRFAQVRLEGEERRKEEEAEKARIDHIETLKERALALNRRSIRKLEEKARKALDAYVAAAVAYTAELNDIAQELASLEPLPRDLTLTLGADGHSLTVGSEHRAPERSIVVCSSMAKEVLRAHIPRGFIDLERPR